jgi:hypothetical protein
LCNNRLETVHLSARRRRARVKTHYRRGSDAWNFGRWLGARSDVIYTIMSDEQRHQRPKGPRPFGLRRKSPPGFVERLDRIADTLVAFLLPERRF